MESFSARRWLLRLAMRPTAMKNGERLRDNIMDLKHGRVGSNRCTKNIPMKQIKFLRNLLRRERAPRHSRLFRRRTTIRALLD